MIYLRYFSILRALRGENYYMKLNLVSTIDELEGVGPKRAELFRKAGIFTVEDLLYYSPLRYEDWRTITSIKDLKPGKEYCIFGELVKMYSRKSKSREYTIVSIILNDGTGAVEASFLNQAFLLKTFKTGMRIAMRGMVNPPFHGHTLVFSNPHYHVIRGDGYSPIGSIIPVYERIGSISSNTIRNIIINAMEKLEDEFERCVPESIAQKAGLIDKRTALKSLHYPTEKDDITLLEQFKTAGQFSLIFEELFFLQMGLAFQKADRRYQEKGIQYKINDDIRTFIRGMLPFKLTNAQKKVIKEIVDDMKKPYPMNRLLQGDVGSGKTIVCLMAMLISMDNGYQTALMTPTEILAEQHYTNITHLLSGSSINILLLKGSLPKAEKNDAHIKIASGEAQIIIGTHALIQQNVEYHKLGMVVIDEQHRFGVAHRALLAQKGMNPDILVMTATPIPRSLALTLYGDLDVSIINELPKGRKPIKTIVKSENSRTEVYEWLAGELSNGRQAYIVCPLIEESETIQAKAAVELYDFLQKNYLKEFKIGLVHGQMRTEERESNMKKFLNKELDVLVATTVIEVGVDVPNATIMIIEHAERFGLSQIHQLRGRVGRSDIQSFCILIIAKKLTDVSRIRIKTIKQSTDGFYIAEQDMHLRGPGELAGLRQSGFFNFHIATIERDSKILFQARHEAINYVEQVLKKGEGEKFKEQFMKQWMQRYSLMSVS